MSGVVTDAWPFVWAAYGVAVFGVVALTFYVALNLRHERRRFSEFTKEGEE